MRREGSVGDEGQGGGGDAGGSVKGGEGEWRGRGGEVLVERRQRRMQAHVDGALMTARLLRDLGRPFLNLCLMRCKVSVAASTGRAAAGRWRSHRSH